MKSEFRVVVVLTLGLAAIAVGFLNGCTETGAAEKTERPDLIDINVMTVFGTLERSPVQFPHDLHTEALNKENKDCTTCHPTDENERMSLKFKRLEDVGKDEVMNFYHDYCIACHNEKKDAGVDTGPVACGDCHLREPGYSSSRRPIGFDKSLHYRHVAANEEKCENCHHEYDEDAKKLVYVKGKENPCRDCHKEATEENRISFRLAAHEDCITCHRSLAVALPDKKTGPQTCAGCHDLERQLAFEIVEDPPRLKREQPDFVLLSVPEEDRKSSKLNTVPFSHVGHEKFNRACRVCHHQTLNPCGDCHTLAGHEKGGGVTLQRAMHDMTSDHSCVGCHEVKKSDVQCAGCHALMEQGRLSEHSCNICHAGPQPDRLEAEKSLYTSIDQFRNTIPRDKLHFTDSEVPDTVTIAVLSDKYEPAVMPHGKIINALKAHIENSKVASYFHGGESVLCQGCHHNGSIGQKPALCENCHGKPFDESNPHKPGLYGAYHQQCLGCHQNMNIKEPSDCVGCHAEKTELAGQRP